MQVGARLDGVMQEGARRDWSEAWCGARRDWSEAGGAKHDVERGTMESEARGWSETRCGARHDGARHDGVRHKKGIAGAAGA